MSCSQAGRRGAWLAVALLLGSCAPSQPKVAADSACRREAYADPHVRALIGAATPSTTNNIFDKSNTTPQGDARAAVQQATLDCMRRRGLALPGGVEPIKHYQFSPLAY